MVSPTLYKSKFNGGAQPLLERRTTMAIFYGKPVAGASKKNSIIKNGVAAMKRLARKIRNRKKNKR